MAGISLVSTTSSSITVRLTGLDSGYSQATRTCYWYVDSRQVKTTTLANQITQSPTVTFTGLDSDTRYTISCEINASGWSSSVWVNSLTAYTDEEEVTTWTTSSLSSVTSLSSTHSQTITVVYYRTYYKSVTFAYSGTATFYSTGSCDLIGYLTTSTSINSSNGVPTSYLITDDDSGTNTNFRFTYNVTAGTRYYLMVKCYSSGTYTSTVYIEPPAAPVTDWTSTLLTARTITTSPLELSVSIAAKRISILPVKFSKGGTVDFYTSGTSTNDTYGFLSTSTSFNKTTGDAVGFLAEDDDSGGARQFKITYEVEANKQYYVFVKAYSADKAFTTTLIVTTPISKIQITKWSWSASNGNATAAQTSAAYTAITTRGSTGNFSYLVWNDLCDKAMEAFSAVDKDWQTTDSSTGRSLLSLANTKMTSTNKILTADRFNALRFNIGARSSLSTGINYVNTGDVVYGNYFTKLTDSLNQYIDDIS